MDSHDSRSAHSPGASADGHAPSSSPAEALGAADHAPCRDEDGPPLFASAEAETLYWRAYLDGGRALGREPGHPHMPAGFDLDLSRGPGAPELVSSRLIETWPEAVPVPGLDELKGPPAVRPAPGDGAEALPAAARAVRHDGWTPERQRIFLDMLARTGVVADACRAAKISRDSAYAFRRRAAGAAFAIGWDAALLIARGAIADDVMSRARHGVVDRLYKDGELVAERHRYDNRLTMAVLARLDRVADGLGENAPVARAAAQEWDQFLDSVAEGGSEEAARFLRNRAASPPAAPAPAAGHPPRAAAGRASPPVQAAGRDPLESTAGLLVRLARYEAHGAGLPCELATADLDPARMESWSDQQWARAEASGFLDRLSPESWPAAAREPGEAGGDGSCRLRRLYLRRHPPAAPPPSASPAVEKDEFEGCGVWEDPELGWVTDFPPPEGFTGHEEGDFEEGNYMRELTPDELEACGADPETLAAEREEELALRRAARDRFFGFLPDPLDPPFAPDQS
jgi:hypothetical protein